MKLAILPLIVGMALGNAMAADAPKNPCNRPEIPNRQASDMVMKMFNKHMLEYKKCINDFVVERRAFAEASKDGAASAQAHDAAEAAIAEYNEQIAKLSERNGDAGEDKDD